MNGERAYYEHLQDIMLTTRGCRFNAAAGLEWQELFSIITTSVLSIYLLSWAVFTISLPEVFEAKHLRFFGAVSIVASVGLLTVSLMEYALKRSVRAEKLQQNAHRISKLMRELERELALENPDFEKLGRIAASYEDEIAQTHINHTARDWRMWTYSRSTSDKMILEKLYSVRSIGYRFWYVLSMVWLYVVLLALVFVPTLWYTYAVVLASGV